MVTLKDEPGPKDFFADPAVKLAFGISTDGLKMGEIPPETKIGFAANGAIQANYPDGSIREFISNDSGGGQMVTTYSDGSRVEGQLSFADGLISLSSISSTGVKTFLTIGEDGVNFQTINADGSTTTHVPANFEELIDQWISATEELAAAISTDDTLTEELADFTGYVDDSAAPGQPSDFYQPGNFNFQGAQLWHAGIFANSIDNSPEAEGFPEVEFTFEEFEEDEDTDTQTLS